MMMDYYGPTGRELPIHEKLLEINWGFITLLCVIAMIGVGMLYSVVGGAWLPYALPHLVRFAVSLGILIIVAMIDIRLWMSLAYPAYAVALILLIGVEIMGDTGKGATRWISLGPLTLQPSEVMKIALVLALARYLQSRPKSDLNHPLTLAPAVLMILMPVALVMHQPDLGTAILLLLCGAGMLFLGGLSWWYFIAAAGAAVAAVPVAWRVLKDYQKDRILTFLDPMRDPMGAGYHTLQSKIGLGSGGLAGKGFLNSTQARLDYLPEKHTDFIFTILGEEFGFIGTFTLLCLYALVLFQGVSIAYSSRSQFGRMTAMGMCLTLLLYVLINISMVVGLIPVVGVPLPLISYGGTAIITIMFGMGLLMSVHIHRSTEMAKR
jgi:rod shape determining protein RodA